MGIFSFLDPIKAIIQEFLIEKGLTLAPINVILLITLSIVISSLSGLINRKMVDLKEVNKQNEEIQAHNKRKKKAKETADKKLWASVSRKENYINDLQRNMMMKRMLPSLITFGPILFVFSTLRGAFQSDANVSLNAWGKFGTNTCSNSCGVATVLPFQIPKWFPLIGKWFSPYAGNASLSVAGFGFFYFLVAISTSTLIQKIFGINLTGMQQPGMK